jgi:acyl-CoA synthetase (AMP-forming)/AMP-acid ligase II
VLLHQIVEFAAAAEPDTTALVSGDRRWTFAQLADLVDRFGSAVAGLVRPGERVAVVADNTPGYVAALYGIPRAGAVLAMGNTRHTPSELAAMLQSCGASVVLGTPEQLGRLAPQAAGLTGVRHWLDLDDMADGAGPVVAPHDAAEHDTAWLIHTSGTTGRPKGAMLTHRSLEAAVLNTTMARPVAADDVYLFPFPLFHVAAYNVVHHHLRRRPVVLLPRFDPVAVMTAIEDERVTSVSLAPTMVSMLLDHPDRHRHDLSSLRQIGYGAAAMPLDLLRRTLAELPRVGLAQGYGMTELSGNAVFLGPDEHRRAAAGEPGLLAAAGRPAPLVQLRLVDDDGTEVAPGDPGEILVRGDQVCAGYWDDPGATAAARTDGWFHTGDVGRIDERGYLSIVDRKKDLIITGGENVSSREIEDVVSEHPAVAAVAAVGIPDERWGERVCAVVVWRDSDTADPDGLVAWTEGRLAGFKRPRTVVSVDALPVNASGKVEKRRVRELVAGRERSGHPGGPGGQSGGGAGRTR